MKSIYKLSRRSLFMLIAFLVACHVNVSNDRKYVADPENCIALLNGGPHSGLLKTKDLYVEYQYIRNSDQVSFSGFVELDFSLTGNYDIVLFFDLMVNFLDSDGLLLKRNRILHTWRYDRIDDKWNFKRINLLSAFQNYSNRFAGRKTIYTTHLGYGECNDLNFRSSPGATPLITVISA